MTPVKPEKLFYYCSGQEASENLLAQSLPWISPAQLDGITELNHKSKIAFSKEDLTKPFVKLGCSLIFAKDEPTGDSALINAIKRWRESERFSEIDEAETVLNGLCGKIVEQHVETYPASNHKWFEACRKTRFLRLFSKHDNFQVWQECGDNFRGVVFELDVETNSDLSAAQPVRYVNEAPELSNIKDQITNLLHSTRAHPESQIVDKLSVKAPALKSQAEWRCFQEMDTPTTETITTETAAEQWPTRVPFNVDVLRSIYLGPAVDIAQREAIVALVSNLKSPPKLYQLKFANGKFDLTPEVIK